MWKQRNAVIHCLAALFVLAGCDRAPEPSTGVVTVYVVRHAEKATDDPRDPSLAPEGIARAEQLARMLGATGVTHLFASEFKRTQQTLQPLAGRTGVAIRAVSARSSQEQTAALQQLPPGAVAVVAGHSNTVPQLISALGATATDLQETENGNMLPEDVYDRMYLLVLAHGRAPALLKMLEMRYAAAPR